MLLFYVRHGDPIYDPDSLTPLGKRQAEAVAKRLALYGIDKVFSSTSIRAQETAKPTCEILKRTPTLLDFANEAHAWRELTVKKGEGRTWIFQSKDHFPIINDEKMIELGHRWYEHPAFSEYDFKAGMERIQREADAFLSSLGYEHDGKSGKYKVTQENNERIAFFAHQGFGLAFLSAILDIPYPHFSTHFDMTHTGMTVINFKTFGEYAYPTVLTLSSDSHLYREGLPTKYNNSLLF
ncbi:MAG: histidine phosphatase family protein [Clostridia bacterium]|nr:histidine phosphatase family protein [Clostridia bacterium]